MKANATGDLNFVGSIGVNMNIGADGSTANQNLIAEENALAYIGVTMVRGGLFSSNVAAFAQLNYDLGIKYDFVVSGDTTTAFNASMQLIEANTSIIDYIEGPNESDEPSWMSSYDGLTGLAATSAEMDAIDTAVHSDPQLADAGIIQASFGIPTTFATYGNHAGTADYSNSHIYFNLDPWGTNPLRSGGYWMQTLLADAQIITPGVPNIVTETGYETLAGTANAVSLIDQAKYLLDDLFDLWNAGIAKTFIYELVDAGPNSYYPSVPQNNYGIYNADWTPKPAAIALHNLTTLLADTGTGGVAPGSLSYSIAGEPSSVQTTLLEKSNGTFVLVIWNDVPLQNTSGIDTSVASVLVTLTLASAFKSITVFDPLTGTSAVQSFANASTVQITVPDHPVLIEISNTASSVSVTAANLPIINAPPDVLIAPGGMVQVGGVSIGNDQWGMINVQVTDSYGTLVMRDANGQALAGSRTDTVALSGSVAIVNAELATLAYTASTAGGGDIISVQANGAAGSAQSDFITVGSITRPALAYSIGPLLSVPTALTIATGSRVGVPDVVLTDDYYANNPGQISLTVAAESGKLQMQVNGSALGPASNLTVTGSYAAVAAALASLTYAAGTTPAADTLSFKVGDASGYDTTASMAVTVAPALAINDQGSMDLIVGTIGRVNLQINDAQAAGNADQLQVTVSDITGALTALDGSGNPLAGSGSQSVNLSGTPDQINGELATLTEQEPGSASSDTITTKLQDSEGASTSGSLAVITVPLITIATPGAVAAVSSVVAQVKGISVTDSDTGLVTETVVVTDLTGILSMTNSSGDALAGSGGHSMTLTGSLAAVNAELATLTYTAPVGAGTDSISIADSDSAGGSDAASAAISVTVPGALPSSFQLVDTAGNSIARQPLLSSGGMVLAAAATGLDGSVSEQVTSGIATLTAQQWNTAYYLTVVDTAGTSYVLNNFRSTNANLTGAPAGAGQAQTLTVNTAQSGTITLGSGNQNVIINAGLGGSTTSTNNGFVITEGSGTDTLKFNGYAGYLPATNVANMTGATVTAGAGTDTMSFTDAYVSVMAGSGNLTVYGDNYGTKVTGGSGTADIWGGAGWNTFTYHSGDGVMTIEDFQSQDSFVIDKSLQPFMTQSVASNGILLSFDNSPKSGILLKGLTSFSLSAITWSGSAAGNVANSAGQYIGISAPAKVTVSTGVVVPAAGISITDSYASANGLTETVVVDDTSGKLSVTDSSGNTIAGSGGHSITLSGSVTVVDAELATLTYTAPAGAGTDNISLGASDTAGGSSSATIAIPVTALGTQSSAFQITDTTGASLVHQAVLSSGSMVLTSAATGLNGAVSEQSVGGIVTLTAKQWNTVYAIALTDSAGETYVLNNFRTANANLTGGPNTAGKAQTLVVNTAQNGTITLGSGNENLTVNAGLGGSTPSANNVFVITEGSGTDTLKFNGYSGDLPATGLANVTSATVIAGAGAETMTFVDAHESIKAGSGNLTVYGSNYGTNVTAGTGSVDIWGGSYWNTFTYHSGSGMMTVEDFQNEDAFVIDKSLQPFMAQSVVSDGILLSFGNNPKSGILLKGIKSFSQSSITWSGSAASNVANSAGQKIGISVPGTLAASISAVVPVRNVAITDSYASSDGLTETVVLNDSAGKLSMTNSLGAAVAGSGTSSILVTGSMAAVDAELATLTYTASGTAATDSISVAASDTAGGSSIASIAVPVSAVKLSISAPATATASSSVILPVKGVSVTDSYAASNGLTETVVVDDRSGKLSMTNAAGNAVAGSGGNAITLTGSAALVDAELATLTYTAPAKAVTDQISISASDTAGGGNSQSIAVPVTALGTLSAFFTVSDTTNLAIGHQPFLSSGNMVLTSAATGLSGGVSEQAANGTVTLTAQQWNTVYAATVGDTTGSSYVLNDFRTANVNLTGAPAGTGQAQTLTVNTAQNGTITLGSGNQNVTINAGLGGATTSTNDGFTITEGSGTDTLTFNGYAGNLPTTNFALVTTAAVTAGSGNETMTFFDSHESVKAGSGNLTVHGSNYGTNVTAGTGTADIWGGSYWNTFTYHSGDGLMTIEDFSTQDTLVLDHSLEAGMTQTAVSGGVELLFSSSPKSEILLKGQTSNLSSQIAWQ